MKSMGRTPGGSGCKEAKGGGGCKEAKGDCLDCPDCVQVVQVVRVVQVSGLFVSVYLCVCVSVYV